MRSGLGYTYASKAAATLIDGVLGPELIGRDAMSIEGAWQAMIAVVRNAGWPGIAACAISAIDIALWDLKGKIAGLPLAALLGRCRDRVPVYGSGGFTSYDDERLRAQLSGWASQGCRWVKMKVGRRPADDLMRAKAARDAIGTVELMVDANGAYSRKQALCFADRFAELDVTWFEEPVSSDDLGGLRLLRDRAPMGVEIAAGEYGYTPFYFRHMLEAGAVDVLQADATRCGGITGFLRAAALADAFAIPMSSHCAPSAHLHVASAAARLRHMEWFHDHVRIEQMLFDGAAQLNEGHIAPDLSRPGLGLIFRRADAAKYEVQI